MGDSVGNMQANQGKNSVKSLATPQHATKVDTKGKAKLADSADGWQTPKKTVKSRVSPVSRDYIPTLDGRASGASTTASHDNKSLVEAWDRVVHSYKDVLLVSTAASLSMATTCLTGSLPLHLMTWSPLEPRQECDYSPRAPHTDCAKDWIATLRSSLGSRYKLVHGLSRGQMRLVVFVHVDSQKAISEVLNGSEATGVGHVVSNKGGICVSLKFWDTSLCFVNCHFAAHEGQCEARNANYKEIVGNIRVSNPNTDILNQFNHVFWLGDLNYRLNNGSAEEKQRTPNTATWDAVIKKVRQKEFGKLFEMDELRREQEAKRALYAFKEGEITFAPTFKMKKDAEDAYEQKRLPAWCDRVLWSSLPGCDVEQLLYSSIPSITTSDHKPVAASFALTAFALPCNSKEDNVDEDDRCWHVRFTALRAKNLRASDYSGSSDPISGEAMQSGPSVSFKGGYGGGEGRLASAIATEYGSLEKLVAKTADIQVAQDLSNFGFMWTYCSRFMKLLSSQQLDLCFANEDEVRELMRGYHNFNPEEGLTFLANYYSSIAVVMLGSKMIDTTSACDLFASGFLFGMLNVKDYCKIRSCFRIAIVADEITKRRYVEFFGPSLFQEVQTKAKFRNLNPIWNPSKDVPVIVLDTFAMERIEKEYILIRVVDFDYTSRDDTLGYGVIPLANALHAFKNGDACNFQVDISYHGCPAGILEGTMQMTWEKNVTKRKLRFTKSLLVRTQSMRHHLKRSMLSKHVISERSD
ncbi:hypothetical protein L7F22_001379 [Adiantum nelumboides]|nr:hypothetical protein [Adiantum nelumboides]